MEGRDKPQPNKPTPRSTVLLEKHSSSTCQTNPRILWNLEVHYRVHNSPPLAHILSQVYPTRTLPTDFFKIHSNVTFYLFPGLPSCRLSSRCPPESLYASLFSPIRDTCLSHLVLDWSLWSFFVSSTNHEDDHPRWTDNKMLSGIMWPEVGTLQIW